MSALDFGARGMARAAGVSLRRSSVVGRALRTARVAAGANPIVNPVLASGGGAVTVAQSASLPGGVADIGNIAAMIVAGTLPMRVFGGEAQTPFGTTVRGMLPKTGGAGGYFSPRFECMVEGTQICFALDTTQTRFRVIADGSYVGAGGVPTIFTTAAGTFVLVTFATGGVHRVGIEREANGAVTAIAKPAISQVWRPDPAPVKALIVGDSYSAGTGASFEQGCWAKQMALRLGWDAVIQAYGGTGYLAEGVTSRFGSADRLNFLTAQPYDIVIVAGGINDTLPAYASLLAESAGAYYRAVRAAQGDAALLVLGAWSGSTGPSSGANSVTAVEQVIRDAVAATGDPMCRFVPVSLSEGGNRPWIFGTGKAGALNTTGNSDLYIGSDGTHPNDAGHAHLGARGAAAVVAALEGMG
jgi:lysophospholipase L1-like esterase